MPYLSEQLRLQRIVAIVGLQERVVGIIAANLDAPKLSFEGHPGLRFSEPGWRHFCLLESMRAVSGLNASIRLYEGGFYQELPAMLRIVAECTTQVDFVIAGIEPAGKLAAKQRDLVTDFFADSTRDAFGRSKKVRIRQHEVHAVLLPTLRRLSGNLD